jgi:hypothetical protein
MAPDADDSARPDRRGGDRTEPRFHLADGLIRRCFPISPVDPPPRCDLHPLDFQHEERRVAALHPAVGEPVRLPKRGRMAPVAGHRTREEFHAVGEIQVVQGMQGLDPLCRAQQTARALLLDDFLKLLPVLLQSVGHSSMFSVKIFCSASYCDAPRMPNAWAIFGKRGSRLHRDASAAELCVRSDRNRRTAGRVQRLWDRETEERRTATRASLHIQSPYLGAQRPASRSDRGREW